MLALAAGIVRISVRSCDTVGRPHDRLAGSSKRAGHRQLDVMPLASGWQRLPSDGLAKPPRKRDDGEVKRGDDESEFYGKIIRRAKRVRELAAESLRRSRGAKGKENVEAAPRSRRKA